MDLNDYQRQAKSTAIYGEGVDHTFFDGLVKIDELRSYLRLTYCITKLNGEAGESAELVAKAMRDYEGGPIIDDVRRAQIIKELGDVLWYVAMAATEMGTTLNLIAEANLHKLADRKQQGKLHGSGSDR